MPFPEALIFDFDGVIVDTEPLHYRAFLDALAPHGLRFTWEQYQREYIGYDDRDALRAIFRNGGREIAGPELVELGRRKADAFQELLRTAPPQSYPGVVELIRAWSARFPLGLCSGALRRDIFPVLIQLDIRACFHALVSADDVAVSKPAPESYRKCFQELQRLFPGAVTAPARCVAIEDTPSGVQAARRAGMNVLAVTHTMPAGLLGKSHGVESTLAGWTPERIGEWMQALPAREN